MLCLNPSTGFPGKVAKVKKSPEYKNRNTPGNFVLNLFKDYYTTIFVFFIFHINFAAPYSIFMYNITYIKTTI